VSPRVGSRPPGLRYHVVTELHEHQQQVVMEATGDAFVAGVATLTGTRITADVDHDGPQVLRERLVAYITSAILEP
jgi:hypothetical protein